MRSAERRFRVGLRACGCATTWCAAHVERRSPERSLRAQGLLSEVTLWTKDKTVTAGRSACHSGTDADLSDRTLGVVHRSAGALIPRRPAAVSPLEVRRMPQQNLTDLQQTLAALGVVLASLVAALARQSHLRRHRKRRKARAAQKARERFDQDSQLRP